MLIFVCTAIMTVSFNACNKSDDLEQYEPGAIPGLGETIGEVPGNIFILPNGIEVIGEINGSISSNNYWYQSSSSEQSIHYYGSGPGYVDLLLKLRNVSSKSITVTFPRATVFVSKSGSTQNGILIQKVTITIPANSDYYLGIVLYCGNRHKSSASRVSVYEIGIVCNASSLIDLCKLLQNKMINIEKFSSTSISDRNTYNSQKTLLQNIVWQVTDGNGLTQSDIDFINSLPNI